MDVNAAIKLNDRDASAYGLRGKILEEQGQAEAALADYNLSLQIDPDSAHGYLTRALWFQNRGETALATKDLMEALRRSPDDPEILNDIAWNMATSPDDTVRNAAKAIQYAAEACDLTHWKNAGYIDTAAAAYAEAGDFEQAVKWQQKAVAMVPKGEHAEDLAEHLKSYLQKQPVREVPKTKPASTGAQKQP
jgi:serine/threonine-protein kinase